MSSFASGKHAFGFCDRTGFRYKLKDLVPQIEAGRPDGMLVGRDVLDKDNPQWRLGMINMSDPQALRNPRPDGGYDQSRELSAFDPVGGGNTALGSRTVGLDMSGHVGRVEIQIIQPDSTATLSGVEMSVSKQEKLTLVCQLLELALRVLLVLLHLSLTLLQSLLQTPEAETNTT